MHRYNIPILHNQIGTRIITENGMKNKSKIKIKIIDQKKLQVKFKRGKPIYQRQKNTKATTVNPHTHNENHGCEKNPYAFSLRFVWLQRNGISILHNLIGTAMKNGMDKKNKKNKSQKIEQVK